MACGCHGATRINVDTVFATEQCWFCCQKHVVTAHALLTEYGYTDKNLAMIDGQLRLAVTHCMYSDESLAKMIRNIAVKIEKRDINEKTTKELEDVIDIIQQKIYQQFPDLKQKHDGLLNK